MRTVALGVLALLTSAPACGHRRRVDDVRGVESYVTEVQFVGVHRFKEKELLAYLNIGETSRLPWKDKFPYTEGLLPIDAERIVEVYRAHGYYDAEVVAMDPSTKVGKVILLGKRKNSRKPGKTTIVVTVREGAPTKIRDLRYLWPEGEPKGPTDPKALPSSIAKAAKMQEGEVFEIPKLNAAREALKLAMQSRGYAFAEVQEKAVVDAGKGVDVSFELRPGPYVKIGEVVIEGLIGVPEKNVRTEIDFAAGRPYSPDLVKRVEQAIYGLEVFESVTVTATPREDDKHVVDLTAKVVESRTQSVQVGVGLGFDPIRWEERVSLLYSHKNLFKNLTKFDLRTTVGYAELPTLFRPLAHGPLLRFEPRLRQKGFLEKKTTWTLAPNFELGIWEGYQFYSPTLRMGASRFFTKFIQLEMTYNLRFVDFFNVSPALKAEDSIVGRDFRDPYTLSYLEPQLNFYFVDSVLRPKNGAIIGAIYDLAGLGGDFSFHKIVPSIRGYYTPHERVTLAARLSVGFIFPFGRKAGAPFDMKFYLGGADSVRGWGLRRLSPKIYEGDCETGDCGTVPIGGQTMVMANFEARVRTVDQLFVAGFFDMGDVREGVRSFSPRNWSYAAGPGLRYASPIGTFRLDLGFRLNDTDRSIGERGWAIHFGLGETF